MKTEKPKFCPTCGVELREGNIIPGTEACIGCHELLVMQESGAGVLHRGPLPGTVILNGETYRVRR